MIKILANKLTTSGITIPEDVYVRIVENRRENEPVATDDTKIYTWLQPKVRLSSAWEKSKFNANLLSIDNMPNEVRLEIPVLSEFEIECMSRGSHTYANELFVEYLLGTSELKNVLTTEDITIL